MKSVRIKVALLKQIRKKPVAERRAIGRRIAQIQETIGRPHLHKGVGLRKLRDEYFEARLNLQERLIFEDTPDALVFEFIGSHDEVKRFLRGR
jgi:hypothetical protein